MAEERTTEEQLYKADDIKLIAYLLARGCRVKDSSVRPDNRVDFFIVGDGIHSIVKEYDMKSKNTLVPVHEYTAAMEHVRDMITRVKSQSRSKK